MSCALAAPGALLQQGHANLRPPFLGFLGKLAPKKENKSSSCDVRARWEEANEMAEPEATSIAGLEAALSGTSGDGELEAALAAIELQSRDSDQRAGLTSLAGHIARRLQHGGAGAAQAVRLVDVLATLARDEAARTEAIACDCVGTLVGFVGAGDGVADVDEMKKLRLACVKALVNFTQGECKESERVWLCIPHLVALEGPELQRYGLMALANLSTGSELVQEQLIKHRIALAAGNILAAKDVNLPVATQALRVLLPLSTGSCKARLVQEDVLIDAILAILPDRAGRLPGGKTASERALAAQAYTATLTLAFNLTGAEKERLIDKGLAAALTRVVEEEAGVLHESSASQQHVETALKALYNLCKSSDAGVTRVVADGLLGATASLVVNDTAVACSPSSPPSLEVAADGGAEAAPARVLRCKLLVLRCVARVAQRAPLQGVLLASGAGEGEAVGKAGRDGGGPDSAALRSVLHFILMTTPDILSSLDVDRAHARWGGDDEAAEWREEDDEGGGGGGESGEHGRGAGEGRGEGEGDVLERALFIVLALQRHSDAGLEWVMSAGFFF